MTYDDLILSLLADRIDLLLSQRRAWPCSSPIWPPDRLRGARARACPRAAPPAGGSSMPSPWRWCRACRCCCLIYVGYRRGAAHLRAVPPGEAGRPEQEWSRARSRASCAAACRSSSMSASAPGRRAPRLRRHHRDDGGVRRRRPAGVHQSATSRSDCCRGSGGRAGGGRSGRRGPPAPTSTSRSCCRSPTATSRSAAWRSPCRARWSPSGSGSSFRPLADSGPAACRCLFARLRLARLAPWLARQRAPWLADRLRPGVRADVGLVVVGTLVSPLRPRARRPRPRRSPIPSANA